MRGRPTEGVEAKRATNISLTPSVWKEFKILVPQKLNLTPSTHIENLMKQEIQKLRGNETPTVDVETLQKQHDAIYKKIHAIQKDLDKRVKDGGIPSLIDACNIRSQTPHKNNRSHMPNVNRQTEHRYTSARVSTR